MGIRKLCNIFRRLNLRHLYVELSHDFYQVTIAAAVEVAVAAAR